MPRPVGGKGKHPNSVELDVKSKAEGEKFAAWDEEGVYSCSGCTHPLYNASDKLVGTHKKPSFSKPRSGAITYSEDYSYGLPRVVASCSKCGQAVGHVYNRKTQKERHILYSASISFGVIADTETKEEEEEEDSGYDSESEQSDVDDKEQDDEEESEDEEEEYEEDDEDEEATQKANIFGRVALVAGAAILLVGLKSVLNK